MENADLGFTELLYKILESIPNSVLLTDKSGQILWVNLAFTKNTGFAFEEVIGNNPRILNSGRHDKSFYADMWNTILSGKVWSGVIYNKYKNNEIVAEKTIITPMSHEGKSFFVAIKQLS
jgi:PAS domain S-box-containing protein